MWLKAAIITVLLLLLASLGSGLAFLIKDKGTTQRTKNALGIRVTLAAVLILLISYGALTGQLKSQAPWSPPTPAGVPLEDIHKEKQHDPDDIDKMPIPGNCLKAEVLVWFEMAFSAAEHDDGKHDCAKRYMHAMKSGEHEKGRSINSRPECQS